MWRLGPDSPSSRAPRLMSAGPAPVSATGRAARSSANGTVMNLPCLGARLALAGDPGAIVFGRLVEQVELVERQQPVFLKRPLRHFERVDAATLHEQQLVAEHA